MNTMTQIVNAGVLSDGGVISGSNNYGIYLISFMILFIVGISVYLYKSN